MGWFARWRERRRLRERGLFSYSDGRQTRWGDPYLLWRNLVNDREVVLDNIAALADQGKEPETTQLDQLVARAFRVKAFDPATRDGLTHEELRGLLLAFYDYLDALKKNGSPGAT